MNEQEFTAQEIVLRYESVEEVTEVYRQPTPLPDYPTRPHPQPHKRRHKGVLVFAVLLVLLLCIAAAVYGTAKKTAPGSGTAAPDTEEPTRTSLPLYTGEETAVMTLQAAGGTELSAQEIYQSVNPAVVSVIGTSGKTQSGGTGMIFSENGFVLTNAHVIEGCSSAMVVLASGYAFDAELVGYDSAEDLAVLKIDGEGLTFPTVTFGDSDDLAIGETAYAIGNPLGIDLIGTFTSGMISGLSREIEVGGESLRLLQTDAALNSGNSGGPLINRYGQVVGINTAKMQSSFSSVEGIGFAIPTADAERKVNDLIRYGAIQPTPVIGITVAALSEATEDGHLGLEVWEVTAGGAGDLAGVEPDDILLSADGKELLRNDDLLDVRDQHAVGETMTLELCRNGEHFTVTLTLQGTP